MQGSSIFHSLFSLVFYSFSRFSLRTSFSSGGLAIWSFPNPVWEIWFCMLNIKCRCIRVLNEFMIIGGQTQLHKPHTSGHPCVFERGAEQALSSVCWGVRRLLSLSFLLHCAILHLFSLSPPLPLVFLAILHTLLILPRVFSAPFLIFSFVQLHLRLHFLKHDLFCFPFMSLPLLFLSFFFSRCYVLGFIFVLTGVTATFETPAHGLFPHSRSFRCSWGRTQGVSTGTRQRRGLAEIFITDCLANKQWKGRSKAVGGEWQCVCGGDKWEENANSSVKTLMTQMFI